MHLIVPAGRPRRVYAPVRWQVPPRAAPRRRPAPPAFTDRTEAGVLLGAALLAVLGQAHSRSIQNVGRRCPAPRRCPATPGEDRPARLRHARAAASPVAAGVARALGAPLDVLVVRKIGHPAAPELGLGAIAEDGRGRRRRAVLRRGDAGRVGLTAADLAAVVARERAELARRVAVYGGAARARPRAAAGPGRGGGPRGDSSSWSTTGWRPG